MIRYGAEGECEISQQSKARNTYMRDTKTIIALVTRRAMLCAALLFFSCCLTSCSIIGSIISLPFRLLDAIF